MQVKGAPERQAPPSAIAVRLHPVGQDDAGCVVCSYLLLRAVCDGQAAGKLRGQQRQQSLQPLELPGAAGLDGLQLALPGRRLLVRDDSSGIAPEGEDEGCVEGFGYVLFSFPGVAADA